MAANKISKSEHISNGRNSSSSNKSWMNSQLKSKLPAVLGVLFVFVAWQLAVMLTKVSPDILPSPIRVIRSLIKYWDTFAYHLVTTIKETLIGLVMTIVAAAVIAVVCDFLPTFRKFLYPILVVSQTVPVIVLAPLMVIWFGYGLGPKIFIIVLVTFFSIAVALTDGFDSTEPETVDLLRSMGATRWQQFFYIRLPAALPSFFTGLRIAITWAVTASIYGEYVGAQRGLGMYMQLCKNDFHTDRVLGSVFLVSALSLILFGVVAVLRRAVIPWATVAQEGEKKK